ncbi:hypothetical protein CL633_04375 [bacterium]|nr:hypothetical protein [bacterium]
MRSREIENYKKNLILLDRQKKILIGTLLGDAHLEAYYRDEVARLKIEHSYKQREYVNWFYREFQDWILTRPKKREKKRWGKVYQSYYFSTLTHPQLAEFRKIFYKNKKKVVPEEFLRKNLDNLGLAVWFMDDGSIKSKQCSGRFLNTQSFTENEVKILQSILKEKFLLKSTTRPDKNGLQIYIISKSAKTLNELIRKHTIPSMRYKLLN